MAERTTQTIKYLAIIDGAEKQVEVPVVGLIDTDGRPLTFIAEQEFRNKVLMQLNLIRKGIGLLVGDPLADES